MRPNCMGCTRKHLSQAIVLMMEAFMGYPIHRWIAMGHLAEAEAECFFIYPDLAKEIRKARLQIQDNKFFDPKQDPDLMEILLKADNLIKDVVGMQNDGVTNTRRYKFWIDTEDGKSEITSGEQKSTQSVGRVEDISLKAFDAPYQVCEIKTLNEDEFLAEEIADLTKVNGIS